MKNLSIVTVCFALSKVFSSIATIIVARYLGAMNFGEARVLMLLAQVLSVGMLFGMHASLMRYGSATENQEAEVATTTYLVGGASVLVAVATWTFRAPLGQWLDLSNYKIAWAIAMAVLFSGYAVFSTVLQALHLFKQRGYIEIAFAALILPCLLVGHLLKGGNYETLLIAYALAYGFTIPLIIWRFRHMLSPKWLFSSKIRMMLQYALFTVLGNVGFIIIFMVQPLQIEWVLNEAQVGIFSVYAASSIMMATFATSIFYSVFFPKVSASPNRAAIWKLVTRGWNRAAVPLFFLFCAVNAISVWLSGDEYPLLWYQVLLFGAASTLITIHSTYSQLVTSQGILGIRWSLGISLSSGGCNFLLSYLLIPRIGISGAAVALIITFSLTLLATVVLGQVLLKTGRFTESPATVPPAP